MKSVKAVLAIAVMWLAGCSSTGTPATPAGFQRGALGVPDQAVMISNDQDYRIGPLDKINIRVFGQQDLSVDKIQVDASGQIVLPLIGPMTAGGKTAKDLSAEIAVRLGEKYLQAPSVSVFIDEAVSQRVTVTGAVMESGIYPLKGQTTLLQAISMAKGPDNKVADLQKVAIFRAVGGQRARAMFDVTAIRRGEAEDPIIYGGDTVIVSDSKGQRAWRELVGVLPGLGIFALF